MIRDEIAEIARLARLSPSNFTEGTYVLRGCYGKKYTRRCYTILNGKVSFAWGWYDVIVWIKTTATGFWRFRGKTRWMLIELTEAEQALMKSIFVQLDGPNMDRERAIKEEEKLRAEKAIVESAETRLLRSVLKAKPQPLTAEGGVNTTAFRLAREAGTTPGTHDELDAKRYFAALNYIHTNVATLKRDCGSSCGECIECIIYTAMTRMNPAVRGGEGL